MEKIRKPFAWYVMSFKSCLTLLLVFLAGTDLADAQITITSADLPSANDTIRYSNANPIPGWPISQAGPNQVWDFSTLTATSQDVEWYRSSLQTPYAFFFLGFNKYGRKIADSLGVGAFMFKDIYNFYRKASNVIEVEGIGLRFQGIPLPAYYTDKDELYQFPLQFNDRDSSTFKFSITLPGLGAYSQVGYRINEVEGWGSITTPFGTFNCLKVKSRIVSKDSLNIGGFPIPFTRRTTEYKWLANGQKIPVLEISGIQTGNNFNPTTIKYRDISRDLAPISLTPLANFTATPTQTLVGSPVQLSNTSAGPLLAYEWSFSPSDPVIFEGDYSDTSKNPVVSFLEPGVYSVKLKASNFFGTNEKNRSDYITILNPSSTGSKQPNSRLVFLNQQSINIPENYNLISAYNLQGQTLPLKKHAEHQFELAGQKGLVFLELKSSTGRQWLKLILP